MTYSEQEFIPEQSDDFDARSFFEGRHRHFAKFDRQEREDWERDMEREGEDYDRAN